MVNLMEGGPGQMWGWVKAKWINQPYGATSGAGPNAPPGYNQRPSVQQIRLPNGQIVTGSNTTGITGYRA